MVPPPLRIPYVLFALERERLFIHRTFRIQQTIPGAPCPAWLCSTPQRPVLVVETGVGTVRALRALDWLLNRPTLGAYEPSLLLCAGFAGALQASVDVGDVILARDVVDEQGNVWFSSADCPVLPQVKVGRLLTTSCFIGAPAQKLALGERYGALAVDMESAALAGRCHERGVPWACMRAVSDDVEVALSVEIAELVESGRVPLGRALRTLARKPSLLPQLLRLARQTRLAARRLADGVIQFVACSSVG
jgi:adenosylhomocysteine nucleosidase